MVFLRNLRKRHLKLSVLPGEDYQIHKEAENELTQETHWS
jgi:hypothetical protein